MTQNTNAKKWLKWITVALLVPGALIAWAFLSGYIFLEMNGLDGNNAAYDTIYQYFLYYGDNQQTRSRLLIAILLGFLPYGLVLGAKYYPKKKKLFGDARFATSAEIRKAGLMADNGIIVGQVGGTIGKPKYLILGGTQHVLMAAPTRSGKGVSVVIPNLLNWPGSVVVLDIKKENWDVTAGFRQKHGQKCYLLNLAAEDLKSHRWNCLSYVSQDLAFRINDIQKIAQMLFPEPPGADPIWTNSARSLFVGIVSMLFETPGTPVTLSEVVKVAMQGTEALEETIYTREDEGRPFTPECTLALQSFLSTPDKTRGSVLKTFISMLEIFLNPVLAAATSGNDFDLREVRKKRMSIYIAIQPGDLERLAPIINLFFSQIIDLNTRELPSQNPELKHQLLLLADEFAALGKVGVLSHSISHIAGYGIRSLPIIQSIAQLREHYGQDGAVNFVNNHGLKVHFAPSDIDDAKKLSEALGTTTVKNKTRSRQLSGKSNRSENVSDHSRPLMNPEELMYMDQSKSILMLERTRPVLCNKVTWYTDPVFQARGNNLETGNIIWPSPDIPTLDLNSLPRAEIKRPEKKTVERDVTAEDIENIDNLSLDDFSVDFSAIEIPKGKLEENEMDDLLSQFFGQIEGESKQEAA